jgi:hypothetical protein
VAYRNKIKNEFAEAKNIDDLIGVNRWNGTNIAFEKAFSLLETREQALRLARATFGRSYPQGCRHANCHAECDVRTVRALKRYYELPEDEDWSPSDHDIAYIERYIWSDEKLFTTKSRSCGFLR